MDGKLSGKKNKDERAVSISGAAITVLRKQKNISQVELAHLLGVNPATMSRWVTDKGKNKDDKPTSTTFLVLIPLLLSVGVDLMPEYYRKAVAEEYGSVFSMQEMKKNAAKLERLARERFWRANSDLQRARKLFDALQEAWQVLDAQHQSLK